jgi:hypothetical protein
MKRFPSIVYSLFLIAVFLYPGILLKQYAGKPDSLITKTKTAVENTLAKSQQIVHFNQSQIVDSMQAVRQKIGLHKLVVDEKMCDQSATIFSLFEDKGSLAKTDLKAFCPQCSQKAYLVVEGNYAIPGQTPWMEKPETTALIEQEYSHMCVYASDTSALLLLGSTKKNIQAVGETDAPQPKNFTEGQLWQALVDYRHAHTKPDLLQSESLCVYARKRVAEHISMFGEKPREEYKNQDKYPLDAHAGFERDGDSGYVFEVTGFNAVAENLAYWPSAEYPNQVIEWGWDTSTEGHREAQLSDEYSHACLAGGEGFYVAIFARN